MYLWTEYKNTEETPQHTNTTVEYNMTSLASCSLYHSMCSYVIVLIICSNEEKQLALKNITQKSPTLKIVVWQKCKIHKFYKRVMKKISVSKINYFNRRVPESKQPMLRWNRQIMLLVAKVVLRIAPHLLIQSFFFLVWMKRFV